MTFLSLIAVLRNPHPPQYSISIRSGIECKKKYKNLFDKSTLVKSDKSTEKYFLFLYFLLNFLYGILKKKMKSMKVNYL